jgi:hypothetical protein
MEHFLFLNGLSFLMAHELDAVHCKEWRIFPGLSLLSKKTGRIVFVLAHIPLLYYIYFILAHYADNQRVIAGIDVFMIVHLGFHLLFLQHKNNEFKGWGSWILIVGAGLFGLADLLIKVG